MVQWLCWNRFRGKLIKHLCKYCKDVFLQTEWKSFYFVGKWSSLFYSLFSYHSCKIGKEKRISRSFFWMMSAIVVMMEDQKKYPSCYESFGRSLHACYLYSSNQYYSTCLYLSWLIFRDIASIVLYLPWQLFWTK